MRYFTNSIRGAIIAVAALAILGPLSLTARAGPLGFAFLAPVNTGDTLSINASLSEAGTGPGGVVTAPGQSIFGIGNVTTITDVSRGNAIVWASGLAGQGQLTFTFNNFTSKAIMGSSPDINITFTGGNATFYYNPTVLAGNPGSPGTPANPDNTGGKYNTGPGTIALTAVGIPGIDPADNTVTLASVTTSLTSPFTGSGDGNLLVTGNGGNSNALFDFLQNSGTLDLFLQGGLTAPDTNPGSTWPVGSLNTTSFQNRGSPQVAAPEPGSLALLGLGLSALVGYAVRRRRAKASA